MTLTADLLDPLLGRDAMGPRVTYYDDATAERVEVSTATLANWAAKTANLLRDEMGAGPGSRVAVLLPAHWQTAAVLLGVWWIGAEVVLGGDPADAAFCTADRLGEAEAAAAGGEVAALSLDPFGKPVEGLPIGLTDYATAVRLHGDQAPRERRPGPALDGLSADEVLAAARRSARRQTLGVGDRVLSDRPWSTPGQLIDNFVAVLAAGASLVQVAHPDSALLARRKATEKVTRTLA